MPKLPTPELLRFPPRSSGGGGGRLQFQVDRTPVPVRLSPSNVSFEGAAEDNLGAPSHHGVARPDVDRTDAVADPHVHDAGPADPFSERGVDNTGPDGQSPSVKALLKGFRIHKPIKLKGTQGNYCDVVLLYEKAWLYGPTSALTLGHKRDRALLLLAADTAYRPIDLCKLFRVFDGAYRQIAYTDFGMRIRFFWPKEADPGSARQLLLLQVGRSS